MAEGVRVQALQRVVVAPGGITMVLEAGQWYEMPADDALELARAGYVQVAHAPADVETASMDDAPGVEHAVTRKGKRK